MTEINRDEWLAALAAIDSFPREHDPTSLTMPEFAQLVGLKTSAARDRMLKLLTAGKAERTTAYRADCGGRQQRVPAYRLVKS